MFKWMFLLLTLMLSINLIYALSVTPSVQDLDYSPGETVTIHFTFSGAEQAEVVLSGALATYSQLLTPKNNTGCLDKMCAIDIKISIPDLSNNPGRNDLTVAVSERDPNPDPFSGAGVSALPKILGIVRMMVPYPGKYLTAKINPVVTSTKVGEQFPIIVEVINYGGQTIEHISGIARIYSFREGEEEYKVELSSLTNLGAGNKGELKALWDTKGVKPGSYGIIANISYDGGQYASTKYPGIKVGDKVVKVMEISPKELYTGKIQKVSFRVENFWNEAFDVYVNAVLKEPNTPTILAEAKSPLLKLENGIGTVEGYLDLTDVKEGKYVLETETFFSGLSYKETYNISVLENTKNATGSQNTIESPDKGLPWTVVLGAAIIITALIIIFFLIKKNSSEGEGNF
jgi:hypothetical protein